MLKCEKCGNSDCSKRIDLVGDPVLCDDCYGKEIYGECDCDACSNSFYEGDKMRGKLEKCKPVYNL